MFWWWWKVVVLEFGVVVIVVVVLQGCGVGNMDVTALVVAGGCGVEIRGGDECYGTSDGCVEE